jgi:hypothetical protein
VTWRWNKDHPVVNLRSANEPARLLVDAAGLETAPSNDAAALPTAVALADAGEEI